MRAITLRHEGLDVTACFSPATDGSKDELDGPAEIEITSITDPADPSATTAQLLERLDAVDLIAATWTALDDAADDHDTRPLRAEEN